MPVHRRFRIVIWNSGVGCDAPHAAAAISAGLAGKTQTSHSLQARGTNPVLRATMQCAAETAKRPSVICVPRE